MLLLLLVGRLQGRTALRLDLHVVGVVAVVIRDRAARKLEDARGHAVEEVTVVRDDQHAARIILQEALEPLDHVDVEMVRRLVEEQKIRLAQQRLRQADARLLAAGEVRDILLEVLFGETEAKGHAADAALVIVAAEQFEALDDLAVSLHRLFRMVDGNLLLERLLALAERNDIIKGAQEFLVERASAEVGLLLDIADGRGLVELDRTAVRLFLTEQAAHECRLAGAIRPDKADLIAARDLETDIVEELIDAERFLEPRYS